MKKNARNVLFVVVLMMFSCLNVTNTKNNPQGNQVTPANSGPDNSELEAVLDGRWYDTTNQGAVLEFGDGKLKRILNGKVQSEADVVADAQCANAECRQEDASLTDGWCFTESNGQTTRCYMVLQCDATRLSLLAIGSDTTVVVYNKMQ
jgi:hypothetical protein